MGVGEGFSEIFLWQRGGELDVGKTMCHRLKQIRPDEDAGTKRGEKSAVSVSRHGGGSDCLIRRIKEAGSDGADSHRKPGEMRPFKSSASHRWVCECVWAEL